MKKIFLPVLSILLLIILLNSCQGFTVSPQQHGVPVFEKKPEWGIVAVPADMGNAYVTAFDRYTEVVAPNGGKIRIVAQNRITNEQIIRARGILEHYLSNVPGALYGSDKSSVVNKMADNGAILTLLNYKDDGSNKTTVNGQSLYEEEFPVEGDDWYINNKYDGHRDAGFEEIFHMVHDYGIGVDGAGGQPGALPGYQQEIRAAQINAQSNGLWAASANFQSWLKEITKENSQTQEYIASVIDSWYGLWGAWNDPNIPASAETGMWGGYTAKNRAEVYQEDPKGAVLMEKFLTSHLSFNARIDAKFTGVFHLNYDPNIAYTHKSQYLKDVTLTGGGNSGVHVNGFDNNITGNGGINTIKFTGLKNDYAIVRSGEVITVTDSTADRDGINTLKYIEILEFSDEALDVSLILE